MNTKVKVVGVRFDGEVVDIGKEASAALPPGRRYRYSRKSILTLEDGREQEWTNSELTKPKLKDSEKRLSENIASDMVSLEWYDYSDSPSMSIAYWIGPKNLASSAK